MREQVVQSYGRRRGLQYNLSLGVLQNEPKGWLARTSISVVMVGFTADIDADVDSDWGLHRRALAP